MMLKVEIAVPVRRQMYSSVSFAGFSPEAEKARRLWCGIILEVAAAGPVAPPAEKCFRPKFPGIPRRADYRADASESFWQTFPVNRVCPGRPSLNGK